MNRREALQSSSAFIFGAMLSPSILADSMTDETSHIILPDFKRGDFGKNFLWGTATASYQIEGSHDKDGKGVSIWDTFSHIDGKIKNNENGDIACDFYNRYPSDIALAKKMNMEVFRFSTAWTRLLPNGIGKVNQKGVDFYNKVIDECLKKNLSPWLTLYHWDLPQALEDKGGWTNRDIINWFGEYTNLCADKFGDRVKNFMILNEPTIFSMLGYLDGRHAPGHKDVGKFLKVVHHISMVQAEAGRILRQKLKDAQIGTTYSCNIVQPITEEEQDKKAAEKLDVLLNRMYIEPAVGLGYPSETLPLLKNIEKFMQPDDMEKLKFDFDFIGIQNYTRVVVKHDEKSPLLGIKFVEAKDRNVPKMTAMKWEVYPEGIYLILKQFAQYKGIKKIIITENGAAFEDKLEGKKIHDKERIDFFETYLSEVLRAKKEGVPVEGYLVWSMLDNYEWAEGYHPRFGLVYVDYPTQKRYIKDSGLWFQKFLKKK